MRSISSMTSKKSGASSPFKSDERKFSRVFHEETARLKSACSCSETLEEKLSSSLNSLIAPSNVARRGEPEVFELSESFNSTISASFFPVETDGRSARPIICGPRTAAEAFVAGRAMITPLVCGQSHPSTSSLALTKTCVSPLSKRRIIVSYSSRFIAPQTASARIPFSWKLRAKALA